MITSELTPDQLQAISGGQWRDVRDHNYGKSQLSGLGLSRSISRLRSAFCTGSGIHAALLTKLHEGTSLLLNFFPSVSVYFRNHIASSWSTGTLGGAVVTVPISDHD